MGLNHWKESDNTNDYFFSTQNCVDRLFKEWKKHGKLFVAVDFDGTVFDFYENGGTFDRVWKILERCQKLDFYIIAYTASNQTRWQFIKDYFQQHGITISCINENAVKGLPYGHWGKIYYNILLDDRAGLQQAVDTLEQCVTLVEETLEKTPL